MSDLLQDGLGGVDSICKQVKGFICDNKQEKYMENCARGDVYECIEEKKYNSPGKYWNETFQPSQHPNQRNNYNLDLLTATDPSQDAILFVKDEKIRDIHRHAHNSVFAMQKLQENAETKDDTLSNSSKRSSHAPDPPPKASSPRRATQNAALQD